MNDIQRGSLSVRVRVIWLDAVNTYGNSPIKLFSKIKKKMAMKRLVVPLNEDGPRRVLNSWCSLLKIEKMAIDDLVGEGQYRGVNTIKKINALIQLRGSQKEDEGSKTENRLVTI